MLEWILKRSKIFVILFLLFIIVGVYTFLQLPQREIPETSINIGTVSTVYPGATVDSVERNITNPIETKLQSIEGIEKISSSSSAGFSSIIVTVADGEDKKEVFSNVRQAISDLTASFPEEAFEPEVSEANVKMPIVSYHLTGNDTESLFALQDELSRWKEEVESVPGISGTSIKGLPEEKISIELDPELLKEKGIILPDVISSINEEFSPAPLGKQEMDQEIVQLTLEHYSSVEEMEKLFVGKSPQGESVLLGDIGKAEVVQKETEDIVTIDGKPSISFTAFVEAGQDIPSVDEAVSSLVEDLGKGLPDDIKLQPYYSQAN
jgi:multidrug efflux pump